jgi:AcrR family transcriptional regulator
VAKEERLNMDTSRRPAHLAGEELSNRHVVLLGDGMDDVYDVLVPFVVEGFDGGDRAVHLVDPALREEHLERLAAGGIDVAAATASRQLDIRTWDESYLLGGAFDPRRQIGFLRKRLAEGRGLGFPATRLIGSLDWAADVPDVMADVLAYEMLVEALVRDRPDVIVCTYDLRRHGARAVADVLGVHAGAVVGGVSRTLRVRDRESARERLLTAAAQLFHDVGIHATGVDALIAAAGVAKATFYRHFPSKDDLVVAWLRDPRARWFDDVRAQVDEYALPPAEAIPRLFDAVAEWLESTDYRGCPYLNTSVEITDPTHPARQVVSDYLQEIEDYLSGLVEAGGYRDPQKLGAELQTILSGSISLAMARRSTASAVRARDVALALLNAAERD